MFVFNDEKRKIFNLKKADYLFMRCANARPEKKGYPWEVLVSYNYKDFGYIIRSFKTEAEATSYFENVFLIINSK